MNCRVLMQAALMLLPVLGSDQSGALSHTRTRSSHVCSVASG